MRSSNKFPYQGLIGLEVEILAHSDPNLVGRHGRVVDETMNSFLIEEPNGRRIRVLKLYGVFKFRFSSGKYIVLDGTFVHGKPEDRLKRMQK